MVSTPRRCRAMMTSRPSSPEPSSITLVAVGVRGVPRRVGMVMSICGGWMSEIIGNYQRDNTNRRQIGTAISACLRTMRKEKPPARAGGFGGGGGVRAAPFASVVGVDVAVLGLAHEQHADHE